VFALARLFLYDDLEEDFLVLNAASFVLDVAGVIIGLTIETGVEALPTECDLD
jgi:hypothetical protein